MTGCPPGDKLGNAAWYYPEPKDAAKEIKDHVAFCKFSPSGRDQADPARQVQGHRERGVGSDRERKSTFARPCLSRTLSIAIFIPLWLQVTCTLHLDQLVILIIGLLDP